MSKYTVQAKLSGEKVEAVHEWEKFGERFRSPGIRNVQPSIEELNKFADAAGWTKYSDTQACFAVISFQRKSLQFADDVQNINDPVVDWSASTHELVTASGKKLAPLGPPESQTGEPLVVQYDSLDTGTNHWIPAMETWDRSAAEVCFDTPTPLAQEPWVRWSYNLPNKTRSEYTFQIRAAP